MVDGLDGDECRDEERVEEHDSNLAKRPWVVAPPLKDGGVEGEGEEAAEDRGRRGEGPSETEGEAENKEGEDNIPEDGSGCVIAKRV